MVKWRLTERREVVTSQDQNPGLPDFQSHILFVGVLSLSQVILSMSYIKPNQTKPNTPPQKNTGNLAHIYIYLHIFVTAISFLKQQLPSLCVMYSDILYSI